MGLIILCLLLAAVRFVSSDDKIDEAHTIDDLSHRLSAAINDLGFKILVNLNREESPQNVVISPASISTTFGLFYLGARNTTEKVLENILGYNKYNLSKSDVKRTFQHLLTNNLITNIPLAYTLKLASAVFINDKLRIKQRYKRKAEKNFLSHVESLNFMEGKLESAERINKFIQNKTNNKIGIFMDNIDFTEDFIGVNALHFKSHWGFEFPEEDTKRENFYNDRDTVAVAMMRQVQRIPYYEDKHVQLVQLNTWGKNTTMMFIVPRDRYGLLKYEETLSHTKLLHYIRNLDYEKILFRLPRLNLTCTTNLNLIYHYLGMSKLFHPVFANFSGMVHNKYVTIGDVLHKAVFQVDEKGVGAPGTPIYSWKSDLAKYDYDYVLYADKPFLFLLIDKRTDLVLLMGRVLNMMK